MYNKKEDIILEKAHNGKLTCKIKKRGKWRYVYSKYHPEKILPINIHNPNNPCVVLGLGLGYELQKVLTKCHSEVYVIEKYPQFLKHCESNLSTKNLLENPKVKLLLGNDYLPYKGSFIPSSFVKTQTTELNASFYSKVIKTLTHRNAPQRNKKVLCFEHPTILNDCALAFETLGYEVKKAPFKQMESLVLMAAKEAPDLLFTINAVKEVADIAKTLDIPYFAWTVDTPDYKLYNKTFIHPNIHCFVYEEAVTKKLKNDGFKNIYHLPVAANFQRLNDVHLSNDDEKKYSCDISFVGTLGEKNEYNHYDFDRCCSVAFLSKLHDILDEQKKAPHRFVIEEKIDKNIVEELESQMGPLRTEELMSKEKKLSYFLGKKYNENLREELITFLANRFHFHVYGSKGWAALQAKHLKYMGFAEHNVEMVKIIKSSKINLNITRIYVESGLPQRIFDVLGAGGFLISNHKNDIDKFFTPGKDLVVYRDKKELIEMIDYYLQHPKERKKIARQGYETIKEKHSFEMRIQKMLNAIQKKHFENTP